MDEQYLKYYDMIKAEQDRNNAWSAEQAQKAMDWQAQMSNTAHQREVADLKAAGLNPVLSAGGSGATTGSGMAASAGNENVTALYGLAKMALESSVQQARAQSETARKEANFYDKMAFVNEARQNQLKGKNTFKKDFKTDFLSSWNKIFKQDFDDPKKSDLSFIRSGARDLEEGLLVKYAGFSRKGARNFLEGLHNVGLNVPLIYLFGLSGVTGKSKLNTIVSRFGNKKFSNFIRNNMK